MRAVVVACIVVFAWNASAKQVEAELGMSSVTGLFVGNVSDGTLWMGSPLKIRVDWAAFIEEDRSKRWRLGVGRTRTVAETGPVHCFVWGALVLFSFGVQLFGGWSRPGP